MAIALLNKWRKDAVSRDIVFLVHFDGEVFGHTKTNIERLPFQYAVAKILAMKPAICFLKLLNKMVGAAGIEPATLRLEI